MKQYELTYLISPELSESEINDLSQKVLGFIEEEKGKIDKKQEPIKKKLGYPIKNKKEAFLVCLDFSSDPEKITDLEKKIRTESQILRHIVIIKEKIKEIPFKHRFKPIADLPEAGQPTADQSRVGKVELKEIDKKIEEILNE
ncbi:MAG: 30S ribosomal protein S6 [bacterium]|nr:30S ribosomal protein S6 [bacterium]